MEHGAWSFLNANDKDRTSPLFRQVRTVGQTKNVFLLYVKAGVRFFTLDFSLFFFGDNAASNSLRSALRLLARGGASFFEH
jgi:hypothetical protein